MNQRNIDIPNYNRAAWNNEVALGNPWTIEADRPSIERARGGALELYLTPTRCVPSDWLAGKLEGTETLCLAGGGGQQGPLLAAAGARVTVFDNSDSQLRRDQFASRKYGLDLETVQGDMADLSAFPDGRFGLIVHPPSNVYVADVRPVWREAFRVLASGGTMIAAFDSPVRHIFDTELAERGLLRVRHRLPYSDVKNLTAAELELRMRRREPLAFGHLLADQIGGQTDAGFLIAGLYEDCFAPAANDTLSQFIPTFAVTRALKST